MNNIFNLGNLIVSKISENINPNISEVLNINFIESVESERNDKIYYKLILLTTRGKIIVMISDNSFLVTINPKIQPSFYKETKDNQFYFEFINEQILSMELLKVINGSEVNILIDKLNKNNYFLIRIDPKNYQFNSTNLIINHDSLLTTGLFEQVPNLNFKIINGFKEKPLSIIKNPSLKNENLKKLIAYDFFSSFLFACMKFEELKIKISNLKEMGKDFSFFPTNNSIINIEKNRGLLISSIKKDWTEDFLIMYASLFYKYGEYMNDWFVSKISFDEADENIFFIDIIIKPSIEKPLQLLFSLSDI